MRKFYIAVALPLFIAPFIQFASLILAVGLVLSVPVIVFIWLMNNEAEVFMKPVSYKDRIIFLALKNRELIPLIGKKISEGLARVGNKIVKIHKNSDYVFNRRILMFASQSEDVKPEDIRELKKKARTNIRTIFRKQELWKSLAPPLLGVMVLNFSSIIGWSLLLAGPIIIIYQVWDSGVLEFIGRQARDEITVFYISGARKVQPTTAKLETQGWANYSSGLGKFKLTDKSDYFYNGNRVFLSGRGVNHTFSLEMAEKATEFSNWGLRDWNELIEATNYAELEGYDSLEDAYEKGGHDFIKEVHERLSEMETGILARR